MGSVNVCSTLATKKFIVLVDNNRISSITNTDKVINMHPLAERFKGFGLNVYEVDGHRVEEIRSAIDRIKNQDKPGVIICNTVKGKHVPFAEWQPIWHYKALTEEQYQEAMAYLEQLKVNP